MHLFGTKKKPRRSKWALVSCFSPLLPCEILGKLSSFSGRASAFPHQTLSNGSDKETNTWNGAGIRAYVGCSVRGVRETDPDSSPQLCHLAVVWVGTRHLHFLNHNFPCLQSGTSSWGQACRVIMRVTKWSVLCVVNDHQGPSRTQAAAASFPVEGFAWQLLPFVFRCYYFDTGLDQLWHCRKVAVVRSLGQILGWFPAIKWFTAKGSPRHTQVSLCDALSTSLLVLPAETSSHGFHVPTHYRQHDPVVWWGWKAPGDPLRSFRSPGAYKDQLWFPRGLFGEPAAAWPGFVLETLPTGISITVGQLSVRLSIWEF